MQATLKCKRCGITASRKRERQLFCSERCRDADKKQRKRSGDKTATPTPIARSGDMGLSEAPMAFGEGSTMIWPSRDEQRGPTPGALQGDDVELEYYEDGFPMLPAKKRAPANWPRLFND